MQGLTLMCPLAPKVLGLPFDSVVQRKSLAVQNSYRGDKIYVPCVMTKLFIHVLFSRVTSRALD